MWFCSEPHVPGIRIESHRYLSDDSRRSFSLMRSPIALRALIVSLARPSRDRARGRPSVFGRTNAGWRPPRLVYAWTSVITLIRSVGYCCQMIYSSNICPANDNESVSLCNPMFTLLQILFHVARQMLLTPFCNFSQYRGNAARR